MERRPNPPNWKPPKAPYNPYDPTDQRPPEGYPSEYASEPLKANITSEESGVWPGRKIIVNRTSTIDPSLAAYHAMRSQMRRMEYVPRPKSDIYPGQHKVLRRLPVNRFSKGVQYTSYFLVVTIATYSIFFARWDDGYETIFSGPYRARLRLKSYFTTLSDEEKEELIPKQRALTTRIVDIPERSVNNIKSDSSLVMERPRLSHIIEADRLKQEHEEAILRAVDIAESKVRQRQSVGVSGDESTGKTSSSRNKWFGIF